MFLAFARFSSLGQLSRYPALWLFDIGEQAM